MGPIVVIVRSLRSSTWVNAQRCGRSSVASSRLRRSSDSASRSSSGPASFLSRRASPRSRRSGAGIDVTTQVTKPGAQPITAIWSLGKLGPAYKVTNLKVAGVNLALTQAADFDAIVQRKGFAALVEMMKSRS